MDDAFWKEALSIVQHMELQLAAIRAELRDCNVIAARIVDKLVRFNATEGRPC